MKPRSLCKYVFAILMLLLFYDNASADKLKTEALEQKSYEISSLRVAIIDKIDQAIERRTYLERRLSGLIGEIQIQIPAQNEILVEVCRLFFAAVDYPVQ